MITCVHTYLCLNDSSGVEHGNLRELALAKMKDLGLVCRDVRTREVGIQEIHHRVKPDEVEMIRRDYAANGGWETFLSYEDPKQDILIGLLRLRKCTEHSFRYINGDLNLRRISFRSLCVRNWCLLQAGIKREQLDNKRASCLRHCGAP